jgi:putative FmdB family regulatory protein
MPVYEFRCTKCGHEFEKLQSISAPNPKCPASEDGLACEGATKKIISRTTFHLKGGGWAADCYS